MYLRRSTSDVIQNATNSLSNDISDLNTRRYNILNSFRKVAEDLSIVNDELTEKIADLNTLANFVDVERESAKQMVQDNESVRQRILDIIGE